MRVLVVDDDVASLTLLEAGLRRQGWEVSTARDGEEGLAAVRETSVDVIVSDILMPRMDGYRFCQEVRADPDLCDLPFVFYTATYTATEDEEFALSIGADGFIVKPSKLEDLVSLVEPLVRLQSSATVRRRPCNAPTEEVEVLRGYSERLVRKLEDKVLQLSEKNEVLEAALETLADEVGIKHELMDRLGGGPSEAASFDIASIEVVPEIIQSAPVAIIVSDVNGRPVRWNRAAEEILGFQGGPSQVWETLSSACEEGGSQLLDAFERMLQGEPVQGLEVYYDVGGKRKDLSLSGGAVRHDGQVVGTVAVVGESGVRAPAQAALENRQERLEELVESRTRELTQANVRLKEAARAKSEFLAGMGHAMRNQLNSIIGFSGVLLQGLGGELSVEQRSQVEMIYAAGQGQLALVNDVVDLSKIEAGQLKVRIEPFELLGLLEKLVESFQVQARQRGISLRLDAPKGVIPMHSDVGKVEQIARNLLSNAVKFTSRGGVSVEVEGADEGKTVVIRVRDSGEGIPPEVMTRIFDEFVKYDPRRGTGGQGTGLGLALTRRYCEMLRGSVSARSNPGEGSVFTVVLPRDISTTGSPEGSNAERSEQ